MVALYIHWPFCLSKCPYCDFNSHVRVKIDYKDWYSAFAKEIEFYAEYLFDKEITSIFFGGGTPSTMPPNLTGYVINYLKRRGKIAPDCEITLEANPTSIEIEKFRDFKSSGINRISIGVQALNDKDLHFLGRKHSTLDSLKAIDIARNVFNNYSFDLIYARPNQTTDNWLRELEDAMKFASNHLSLYQLTIEKGTSFYVRHRNGEIKVPNEEEAYKLYMTTAKFMQEHGMPAYEVSNYAQKGYECRHNLSYWHYDDYLGIGPGAHSRISYNNKKYAMMNIHHPENWLKKVFSEGNGRQQFNELQSSELIQEYLLMGLRLIDGVNINMQNRYSIFSNNLLDILSEKKLQKLVEEDLIEIGTEKIKCTDRGIVVLNSIINFLVGDLDGNSSYKSDNKAVFESALSA